MKLYYTLILMALFMSNSIWAKEKFIWEQGLIVLNSGESLKGEVNYNALIDVVTYRNGKSIKSFSASNVEKFQFFDTEMDEIRKFVTLYFNVSKSYKSKVFFEVVLPGDVVLLRRSDRLMGEGNPDYFSFVKNGSNEEQIESFTYYALFNDEYIPMKQFKKQVLPYLKQSYGAEIDDYIEENNLRSFQIRDQILIVDYYNFLSDPNTSVYKGEVLLTAMD